jgi:hypothetical protein
MAYRKTSGAPGSTAQFAPEYKSPKQAEEEAQQLLASFGNRILEMLKAGGQKLDGMDRAYAEKLVPNPTENPTAYMTRGMPISQVLKGVPDAESPAAELLERAFQAGVLGSNVASRYALPAGAAMLGAKGLADITNGIYDEASDIPLM